MSDAHLRIPVRLPSWEELNRRVSEVGNYLLDNVPTKALMIDPQNALYTCNLLSPSVPISPYIGPEATSYYATTDLTTGTITVQEAGLYRLSATIDFTGGIINESYYLEAIFTLDGLPTYTDMASAEWTNKTLAIIASGSVSIAMGKGDSCAVGIYSSTATTLNVNKGEIYIEQVT